MLPAMAVQRPIPMSVMPPLPGKDQLNDLLWDVATTVELMGEAALADTPLSLPSCGLLAAVLGEPGITIAEIARRVPKTQQAVSQLGARLQKLGYLERRLGSGRGVGLYVTPAGREVAREGIERERELDQRLRDQLGDERYDELKRLLGESRAILSEAR